MDSLRKPLPSKPLRSDALTPPLPYAQPLTRPPQSQSPSVPSSPQRPTLAQAIPRRLQKKNAWLTSLLIFFAALIFLVLCAVAFLLYKGFSVGQSMQFQNQPNPSLLKQLAGFTASLLTEKRTALRGEATGRINILLLGRAGEHYPGKNLTDTIMLMSIDTQSKKIALLSLPRDLYTPIHATALYTKINSLYQYGLSQNAGTEPLEKTVEDITGQPIHYFFVVDFDGFERVINTLGGVSIDVTRDFYDTRYPGKNYSYETFEIKKGWQTLDGATALKYVRERHDDPEGDFGRAKRQQQVIQAVKDKATSGTTFLNIFTINSLLDTLGENVKTNMSLEEMQSFIELAKKLDTQNVTSVVVDAWKKESLLRVSHILVGSVNAFILVPRAGNWNEIQEVSEDIFHLDALKERRAHIAAEEPTLTVFYAPEDAALVHPVKDLTEEMGFAKVSFVSLSPLEVSPEKSTIVDRSALGKPFSLNALLHTFGVEKASPLWPPAPLLTPLPEPSDSDFILVMGNDLASTLSLAEESGTLEKNAQEEPVYSDVLPPQPQPTKKKKE